MPEKNALNQRWWKPAFVGLLLIIGVATALLNPTDNSRSESAVGFDSERALLDVKAIAAERHPSGSPQERLVRDYIVGEIRRAGLTPELQDATVLSKGARSAPGLYFAGRVAN